MGNERVYGHVTFHPYQRSEALWEEVEDYFYELAADVATRLGFEIIEMVAMPDHVHLLLCMPPWLKVVDVIGQIKGYSARRILQGYPELRGDMKSPGFWAAGYHFVRHTEASLPKVLRYIETQKARGGLE
ncbi:MAG: IS200/IS605 family transposase [Chloroflexi bacterium]|nr:IS200/IS605 family transposase [Chloroflexota bacterium]